MSANPHLPPAPADGKHDFEGSTRCRACGAYSGSPEAENRCEGQWAESSKMRSWAGAEWSRDLLQTGIPRRIALIVSEKRPPIKHGGTLWTNEENLYLLLACGHKRSMDIPPGASNEEIEHGLRLKHMATHNQLPAMVGCEECEARLAGSSRGTERITAAEDERRRAEAEAAIVNANPWELPE